MSKLKKWLFILTPIILGSIVGFIISSKIDYSFLRKPPLSPPKLAFPVMWSIIYLLLGISYYLYRKNENDPKVNKVYYVSLFINYLWSIIFFLLKLRGLAVLWIILLDISVIYLFILYLRKNKISAYLNIIYLLWVIFATYLNIGIYLLN